MAIIKMKGAVAKNLLGRTDWERVRKMTDAEIKAAVSTDPAIRMIVSNKQPNFRKIKE